MLMDVECDSCVTTETSRWLYHILLRRETTVTLSYKLFYITIAFYKRIKKTTVQTYYLTKRIKCVYQTSTTQKRQWAYLKGRRMSPLRRDTTNGN